MRVVAHRKSGQCWTRMPRSLHDDNTAIRPGASGGRPTIALRAARLPSRAALGVVGRFQIAYSCFFVLLVCHHTIALLSIICCRVYLFAAGTQRKVKSRQFAGPAVTVSSIKTTRPTSPSCSATPDAAPCQLFFLVPRASLMTAIDSTNCCTNQARPIFPSLRGLRLRGTHGK